MSVESSGASKGEAAGLLSWRDASGAKTFRELVSLAWPIAAAMAGETAMGLVDTKLVGALGPGALGGVGVGAMLMYLNYAIVFGLMRAVKVRTAYAFGRGTPEHAVRYAQAAIAIGLLCGLVVWAIARDIGWVLVGIGIDSALIPYARDFFAAVTWGAPGACVLAALIQHRQASGDARTPMVVQLCGNVVNATLAYGMIHGRFGLPALGVRGAGYATAMVVTAEALVLLALLVRDVKRIPRAKLEGAPSFRVALREVTSLGLPTGLQFGTEMLAMTTFTAILGGLGPAEIAAHQVAMATIRTSFLPGVAVAEAACVLVGKALGKRDLAEADRVTRSALLLAVGFMAACGVVFAVFGGAIARGFADDEAVCLIARRLLFVAALFQVLDAVNIVLRGALRGAKDVRATAIIGILVVWTCVPGAAFLLGKLAGWGSLGGWCGFIAETVFASALFWLRWTRGSWRRDYQPAKQATPAGNDAPLLAAPVTS